MLYPAFLQGDRVTHPPQQHTYGNQFCRNCPAAQGSSPPLVLFYYGFRYGSARSPRSVLPFFRSFPFLILFYFIAPLYKNKVHKPSCRLLTHFILHSQTSKIEAVLSLIASVWRLIRRFHKSARACLAQNGSAAIGRLSDPQDRSSAGSGLERLDPCRKGILPQPDSHWIFPC